MVVIMFSIPIVLFIFKRDTGLERIMKRIKVIEPNKLYIIADGPRNDSEKKQCDKCRNLIEKLVDWDCEIIKDYSDINRGVLDNIGLGAKRVFEKEKYAIFLEDDNLPETTFFYFCEDLLTKYEKNESILWICGTNYLEKYDSKYDYVFTQHLLPCGWASWSEKYIKYYDSSLEGLNNNEKKKNFKESYKNRSLYNQQLYSVERTKYLIDTNIKKSSWDYQMLFTLRANKLYGIAPCINQIENIGVDSFSTHGGSSYSNVMTKRFCSIKTDKIRFPLKHPKQISIDINFEKKIGKILLIPYKDRIFKIIAKYLKKLIGLNQNESFKEYLNEKKGMK